MAFYAVNQVINGKIDCHGMVRIRAFCQTQFILGLIRVRERLISMTFFHSEGRNKQNDCTAVFKALEEHFTILISFE